ncbi:hypothetical protein KKH23_05295 [Patescibacteria group bacterium]|nr:hypothetical protein [Patescibacteria group bacterium]
MTRFYGFTPEYQLKMLARTWLLYSRSISPISALEQAWELGVTHSADPQKLMKGLRRTSDSLLGVAQHRKTTRKRRDPSEAPALEQVASWLVNPQLRKFITIRKAKK